MRPTGYTEELGHEICERIATTAQGLDLICDNEPSFPSARTVARWLEIHPAFCQSYVRARERQADLLFDQCLEIADKCRIGEKVKTLPDGSTEVMTGDMIERARLQVDTRMRMAGKLHMKKYGDKAEVVHSGAVDHRHTLSEGRRMELMELRKRALGVTSGQDTGEVKILQAGGEEGGE